MDVLSYIPSISLWIRWQPNPPLRRASSFRKGSFMFAGYCTVTST